MKITIMDCPEGEEDEIIIKCRQVDEQMLKMIHTMKMGREKIIGTKDGSIMQIDPGQI